jgi:hypothetical protein
MVEVRQGEQSLANHLLKLLLRLPQKAEVCPEKSLTPRIAQGISGLMDRVR